ncbi:ABC transporter permease [Xanthomonas sacchari]
MSASQLPIILRSLLRHRLLVAIVLLQVVITTAAVTNIVFLLTRRVQTLTYQTGLEESGLAVIETDFVGDAATHVSASVRADLEALRQIPGVSAVAATDSLPLSQNNWTVGVTNKVPDQNNLAGLIEAEPTIYGVSHNALGVLGLRLVGGSDFSPGAYVPMAADNDYAGLYAAGEAIISEALAKKLFPSESAVGKTFYVDGNHALHVVGVVQHLSRPLLRTDADNDLSMLLPLVPDGHRVIYAIRTDPTRLQAVLSSGLRSLQALEANRLIPRAMRFTDLRSDYFRRDRTMAIIFLSAGASLLLVTGIGIHGIASFWVRQRYLHIGIRRALGASYKDIVRYFLLENLLLTGSGALLGTILAVLVNVQVSRLYAVPRIDPLFLLVGFPLICALGQAAAWLPASRAAKSAPIVTLRSA